MSDVKLVPITPDNIDDALNLKVADHQNGFIASVAVSLAEAYVYVEAWPRGIIAGDNMVGFLMLDDHSQRSIKPSKPHIAIWRLMIDARYQGHGYGRAAIQLAMQRALELGCDTLHLSCVPDKNGPIGFYKSLGFIDTGKIVDDELVMQIGL